MSSENEPKVKFGSGKIDPSQLQFMKLIEKQNAERVQRLKRVRKNNLLTGLTIGASVLAIYGYSMWSVKQEKFLDDFEEPKKVLGPSTN